MSSSRRMGSYEVGETLGTGMSAEVKLGRDINTGETVALKLIDRSKMNERSMAQLHREIEAMKTIRHPNVLELKHVDMRAVCPNLDGTSMEVIMLVLELAGGGELFDFMMYTGAFSEDIARTYFVQLLSSLQSCHANNIYHRDIKPENLLLDSTFQLKLADFGLSSIQDSSSSLIYTECGTRSYMAPEVMSGSGYDGSKADVWSAGVVLFIMLAGNPPFQIANNTDWWFKAIASNRHDRFWAAHLRSCPTFPELARALLNRIFVRDHAARSTIDEVLADAWISKHPILSADEVYNEMMRRRTDVLAAKEREKQAAKAQRAQATGGRGGNDPFARDANRALVSHAPLMGAGDDAVNCIYSSHEDPREVMGRLAALWSVPSNCNDYVISTNITQHVTDVDDDLPSVSCTVQARVMESDGVLVLKFEKMAGDVFCFKQEIENVRQQLKDIVVAIIPAIALLDEDDEAVTTI